MTNRRGHGEGSIFFQEDRNRWLGVIDVPIDAAGRRRRVTVTGRTKTLVRNRLKELQRAVDLGLPVSNGSLTFGAYLDHWLADAVPARASVKSANTRTNYAWAVEKHLRPTLGAKQLRSLTPDDVEQLLKAMAARGLARSTVARVRMVAATALRHAQRRDMVARNAAELADLPGDARPAREGRSHTPDEARAVLSAAADDPVGPLAITGLMLGLRPGELTGLRWADIDFAAGVLHVRQARKQEKDANGHDVLTFGDPKTSRSRRSLRLPKPVADGLQRQRSIQARQRLAIGAAWVDHDLVFATAVGTPIHPANLRRAFGRLTKRAGVGDWTPRELRHSAASLLSASGVPMEEVMDVLGHVDTRMLERVYRHRVKPTIESAAAPMERLFGSAN